MINITEMPAFKACLADSKLVEVALLDVCEVIARKLISGRPTADVLTSLDFLRQQLEKGPGK